ncbi:MAG: DHH family phosphoesterase [Clostridia bacterium]|nr:DHH family phosphoesterase [Clostridia bacterium]
MNELSFSELIDLVIAAEKPVLLTHTRPDGDTVGSCAALASLFDAMGRDPIVVSPDVIPRRLSFLSGGRWFSPVKKYPAGAAVIAVDVASPQQLGGLQTVFSGDLAPSFMIDHHERGVAFAPRYLRSDASAVGEIVYDIAVELVERGVLKSIPPFAVNAIFASVSSDSGCFKYSNVTPRTHRIAASLIELGADAPEINRLLFDVKTEEILRAEGYVESNSRRWLWQCPGGWPSRRPRVGWGSPTSPSRRLPGKKGRVLPWYRPRRHRMRNSFFLAFSVTSFFGCSSIAVIILRQPARRNRFCQKTLKGIMEMFS